MQLPSSYVRVIIGRGGENTKAMSRRVGWSLGRSLRSGVFDTSGGGTFSSKEHLKSTPERRTISWTLGNILFFGDEVLDG